MVDLILLLQMVHHPNVQDELMYLLLLYENYCNFSNETKERSIKVREISWYPFRKLKELYQIFCGTKISHETIRKAQIVTNELYYPNKDIEPSGFYCNDVQ